MKITIVVSVTHHPQVNPPPVPANPGVGWVDAFDDDLVLERYNNRTPGDGRMTCRRTPHNVVPGRIQEP
jgi:hypothetical protein